MNAHHDPEQLLLLAKNSARLHGCTCAAEVEVTELDDGIYQAEVRHDSRCHLLLTTRAIAN